MAEATYVSSAGTTPHTPGGAISSGQIVVLSSTNGYVGVAPVAIAAAGSGTLNIDGLHAVTKQAGVAISSGAIVYWDDTNNYANTTSGGNTRCGLTPVGAAAGDATVLVDINR